MSLWYDKKGKTYASKGSSSWVKYYAEHLASALAARLEGHYKGTEGKHRADHVLVDGQTSVTEALDTKVDKISGMGLSHQDYTADEKEKLAGIAPKATAVGTALAPTGTEAFNDPQNTTNIPYAHIEGRSNFAILRTFLIKEYTKNTVTLDSVIDIEPGMSWFIFLKAGNSQERFSGTVVSIEGKTVTLSGNTELTRDSELDVTFTPSTTPSFFGTFFVNGGSIGPHTVTDTSGNFSCHLEGRGTFGTLDSHAEGFYSYALGYASHAEGKNTTTVGECSHTEGYGTTARGIGSHAEGGSCQAIGFYSHAEGGNTAAQGKCAHTEGNATTASGEGAHAEGTSCIASGNGSHAEGGTCQATGNFSHAEGALSVASGTDSHAEGGGSNASAFCAHAEGGYTTASGTYSHAEGYQTVSTKSASHAEGQNTEATADFSHAEGLSTKASGKRSHAEGSNTTASGINAHAEGGGTLASGGSSHAEGEGTIAQHSYSHAEGLGTRTSAGSQHVQGKYNQDGSNYAHIVGNGTSDTARSNAYTLTWDGTGRYAGDVYAKEELLATKKYVDNTVAQAGSGDMFRNVYDTDHTGIVDDAERLGGQPPNYYAKQSDMENKPIEKGSGISSIVIWDKEAEKYGLSMRPNSSGFGSLAANLETTASGDYSSAFGSLTHASGNSSFAIGSSNQATENASFAAGYDNCAKRYQTVIGKNSKSYDGATGPYDTTGSAFIVGAGSETFANAFRVTNDGYCYGQNAFGASGADYAEYFEWADKNLNGEDRRGYFVTLEGNKIRKANGSDSYLLGIVSATPVIEGNAYTDQWQGMYQTDIFGQRLTKTVEVPESIDEKTGKKFPAHTETRYILNHHYDASREYRGRNERPEWSPVGMMGQLVVIDDGSCEVDGFCQVADGGIATKSDTPTSCRVIERLDVDHIRVLLR